MTNRPCTEVEMEALLCTVILMASPPLQLQPNTPTCVTNML